MTPRWVPLHLRPYGAWAFVASGFGYMLAGGALAAAMGLRWLPAPLWIPAHTHLLLIGWMTFLIYGLGYLILPLGLTGRYPLSSGLAWTQFWLAHAATWGVSAGTLLARMEHPLAHPVVLAGGAAHLLAALTFVVNLVGPSLRAAPPPTPRFDIRERA
ncbi:MAG: hypothetical protein AAB368_07030 [bacterium]